MIPQSPSTTHQPPGGAMTIEEWLALINSKLDRIIGAYFPDERQAESRFFLDSIKGMSVDEIIKANRERNKRLKEAKQREAAAKQTAKATKHIMGRAA